MRAYYLLISFMEHTTVFKISCDIKNSIHSIKMLLI